MNNLNKMIRTKVLEIFFVILFIIGTYIPWNSLHTSETYELLKRPNPTSYAYVDVIKYNNYEMYPMKDDTAIKMLMPNSLQVINSTYLDSGYSLGIRIKKESTLDYKTIKISFHEKVFYLKEFFTKEDENYYYFLLEQGSIKANTLSYDIKMWIEETPETNVYGKKLIYDFVNLDSITM